MAFGFDVSVSFGRFFPDGEFLGYHEQLQEHYMAMSMNGSTEHRSFADFLSAHVKNMHGGTDFIANEFLPRRYTLFKKYKSLADVINLGAGIAISQPLRELVERLEPRRHQLWPVEIADQSGRPQWSNYSMLRVLSQIDAFDMKNSDPACWRKSGHILKVSSPKKDHAHGIALKQSVVSDHHIWRGFVSSESGISGFDFYVSDTLKSAIEEAGLRTMPFCQLKEV